MDLFYGRANYIDEHGDIIRKYDTREFQLEEFKGRCIICQPAAFWCRRIMDRIGLFDEDFQTAMDYEYWQRIAANKGLIARIDKLLACSRQYSATKTKSQRGKVYKDVFRSQWRNWGTFIQSGRWDSSITPKTSAAPCGVPSFRLPSAGTYLISYPVSFAGGLSSLNRRTVAGGGIFGNNSVRRAIRD